MAEGIDHDYRVDDPIVTERELAQMMRCSEKTLKRLRDDGMPYISWGRRLIRYRAREAMAWAEQRQQRKAPDG